MPGATIPTGMVVTTEWLVAPDGRQYRAFAGQVDILGAEATLGIKPGDRDQTWYAQVTAPSGTAFIPGCKVAMVYDTAGQDLQLAEVWH